MANGNIVEQATQKATELHRGQWRRTTNEPFITHPIAVGQILKGAHADNATIAAGILLRLQQFSLHF